MSRKIIAFDNETFLISRERPAPQVVCTSFCDGKNTWIKNSKSNCTYREDHGFFSSEFSLKQAITTSLENPNLTFVGHNVAYDFATLASSYPTLLPLIFKAYKDLRVTDTGIRQQLIDIASGRITTEEKVQNYSLAMLYEAIFDKKLFGKRPQAVEESIRLNYDKLYDVDLEQWPQEALDYSLQDAKATYEIYGIQQEKAGHLLFDDHFQAYSAFVLTLMQMRGMITDKAQVALLKQNCEKTMTELEPILEECGLLDWDKRQEKWVKRKKAAQIRIQKACEKLGRDPILTAKKAIAIDRAACHWSEDELMLKRADYVTAEKLLTTYYPPLSKGCEGLPITTRFNMAATGRTTSSAPGGVLEGTNLQNPPRKGNVRECFIPRPGYVFLAADFSGAELHTLAQVCKDLLGYSDLGDALKKGEDVHLRTASRLLEISYEEAKELLDDENEEIENARGDAKAANFGFPGGMFEKTFILTQLKQTGKIWDLYKVRKLRKAWLKSFSEMNDYFDLNKKELGPAKKAVFKLHYSGRLRTVKGLPVALNTRFQALASDGGRLAKCEVSSRCYVEEDSALYGCFPVNWVHDELILEVPLTHDLQATAKEFVEVMENEFNKVVPEYPTKVDAVLMDRWSKKAKPIYNEKGELQIWTC